MKNSLKNKVTFIVILFVSLILPFNVWAKQTNTFIREDSFDDEELISGDTIQFDNVTLYIPVEEQEFSLLYDDKVINFEYYIIDSIDSNGNIKYKKYVYSDSNKSLWNPNSSSVYVWSGELYSNFNFDDNVDYYNLCPVSDSRLDGGDVCNIILPAVNGKISRWRFDSKEQGDKKDIDVCSYTSYSSTIYSSCDKTEGRTDNTYIGTYEYYTSYTYRFYELPEEQPKLKVTCDTNELSAGKSTKCTFNVSYKYGLSSILFDITSDKLKINNLKLDDFWFDDSGYSPWNIKEIDNGYSINFALGFRINNFKNNPLIATFEITADEDINDVIKSLNISDIKYVEKTGDSIATAKSSSDDESALDDVIDNIINPSTFRNSFYLIIGVIVIGGICFIQLKSKKKNK